MLLMLRKVLTAAALIAAGARWHAGAFVAAGQSHQMALVQTDTGWRRAW